MDLCHGYSANILPWQAIDMYQARWLSPERQTSAAVRALSFPVLNRFRFISSQKAHQIRLRQYVTFSGSMFEGIIDSFSASP